MHAAEDGQVPGTEVEGDRVDLVQYGHAGECFAEDLRIVPEQDDSVPEPIALAPGCHL
ncbi:hypothetical protein GCM10027430_11220 [Lysobacter tyrosinilyticus]